MTDTDTEEQEAVWAFYRSDKAWYADVRAQQPDQVAEVMVTRKVPNDGCEFEFKVEWLQLHGEHASPHLCVFDDAWAGLMRAEQEHGLLSFFAAMDRSGELRSAKPLTADEFCDWLIRHGFIDVTDYTNDNAPLRRSETDALDEIALMLRDPDWGPGMLEDIAELVTATGRDLSNPDETPTWDRH